MRYTFRTIKVKRGKGFTFTVVSRDRGVVPCWPESNRATRNVKLDGFLNLLASWFTCESFDFLGETLFLACDPLSSVWPGIFDARRRFFFL